MKKIILFLILISFINCNSEIKNDKQDMIKKKEKKNIINPTKEIKKEDIIEKNILEIKEIIKNNKRKDKKIIKMKK